MNKKGWCRVCEQNIGFYGWGSHVAKHKREYLRELNLDYKKWFEVEFEEVVKLFNVKNAKSELNTKIVHMRNKKLHEFGVRT